MYINFQFISAGTPGTYHHANIALTIYRCSPRPIEGSHIARLMLGNVARSEWRVTGKAIQAVCEERYREIPMPPELYGKLSASGNLDLETGGFGEIAR